MESAAPERIHVPHRKRLFHSDMTSDSGGRILRIDDRVRARHLFHALSVPVRMIPYLRDVLDTALRIRIERTATTLTIVDRRRQLV